MRYDKRVTLISKTQKRYDPELGKVVGRNGIKKIVPCHISSVRSELIGHLSDKLTYESLVVRVGQNSEEVDSLIIDGRPFYIVKRANHGHHGQAFYVNEDKHG